jgi:O-antigen biosynthesis protein
MYLHDPAETFTLDQMRINYRAGWPWMKTELLDVEAGMEQAGALVATSWETAYRVFNTQTDATKCYLVQDYEPYFFPVGSNSLLAENTYRFGFKGITAGGWLKHKLSQEYHMECDDFPFGSDVDVYHHENRRRRKDILFYARPLTERRGFDFGCLVLEEFNKLRPDAVIHMVGADLGRNKLPFPYVDHGSLSPADLNKLYNKCAAGLVLSLTNLSLLPLELLGAGCIPVVNDGPNNRMVSDNPFIKYVPPSPQAMALGLAETVGREDQAEYAGRASASVENVTWDKAGKRVEEIFRKYMNG